MVYSQVPLKIFVNTFFFCFCFSLIPLIPSLARFFMSTYKSYCFFFKWEYRLLLFWFENFPTYLHYFWSLHSFCQLFQDDFWVLGDRVAAWGNLFTWMSCGSLYWSPCPKKILFCWGSRDVLIYIHTLTHIHMWTKEAVYCYVHFE